MIRHPFKRPAPPSPEITLPAINMLDELAVAHTTEPTSNIMMHHAKTHWKLSQLRESHSVMHSGKDLGPLLCCGSASRTFPSWVAKWHYPYG